MVGQCGEGVGERRSLGKTAERGEEERRRRETERRTRNGHTDQHSDSRGRPTRKRVTIDTHATVFYFNDIFSQERKHEQYCTMFFVNNMLEIAKEKTMDLFNGD